MACIDMSDDPTNEVFAGIKFQIGQPVRVVQAKGAEGYPEDTRTVLCEAVGNVYEVRDVNAWETGNPEKPYVISYELRVSDEDFIFMDDEELEPA